MDNDVAPAFGKKSSIGRRSEGGHYSKGTREEDFDQREELGRGSIGKVVLVRKKQNDRLYAMKIIKKSRLHTEEDREGQLKEKNVMANLKSPFISQLRFSF